MEKVDKKVLLAVDDSTHSRHALAYAARLREARPGARLHPLPLAAGRLAVPPGRGPAQRPVPGRAHPDHGPQRRGRAGPARPLPGAAGAVGRTGCVDRIRQPAPAAGARQGHHRRRAAGALRCRPGGAARSRVGAGDGHGQRFGAAGRELPADPRVAGGRGGALAAGHGGGRRLRRVAARGGPPGLHAVREPGRDRALLPRDPAAAGLLRGRLRGDRGPRRSSPSWSKATGAAWTTSSPPRSSKLKAAGFSERQIETRTASSLIGVGEIILEAARAEGFGTIVMGRRGVNRFVLRRQRQPHRQPQHRGRGAVAGTVSRPPA